MTRKTRLGDGQSIATPPEIVSCQKVLRRLLHQRVGFGVRPMARGAFEFHLQGDGGFPAFTERNPTVFEIHSKDNMKFWLSVSLIFEPQVGEPTFASASLVFFRGALGTEPKEPLIRAEWDHREDDPKVHAQPHWHVYTRTQAADDLYRFGDGHENQLLVDEATDVDDDDAVVGATRRMHLAMCADWQDGEPKDHYCTHSVEGLARWLNGCIPYTCLQLNILARRRF